MRIAITGAGGFLGAPLVRLLAARGDAVAAIVRPGTTQDRLPDLAGAMRIIEGDLDTIGALEAPLADFRPDVLVHAAWAGVGAQDRDRPGQLRNVVAAGELAALAGRLGASTFIGIGSQAEYGPVSGRTDEAVPARPVTLYGIAKLSAALATQRICAQAGLRWAWLRVFSLFGPRDNPQCLIPALIEQIGRGQRPQLTACTQRWDYLYVEDAAAAVAAVARTPSAAGLFNLGSGRAPPLLETVIHLRDLLDPTVPLGVGEIPYGPNPVMHLEADIGRLTALTGWRPTLTLGDGLRATIAWHRNLVSRTP
ncbi:nucleoside-diphosphate-sugar epimerase [Nitrospirillum amazonense]|uniref:Nucleoside-diphosphate-sugar epimerase n=1 Tax=Nitrospirillum amazonense TaxID=28077 RepID=A0A560FSG9_9PROT|nr:nucleoside-diphosphate-sugar epimerase [Nitrospirillum amazonense]